MIEREDRLALAEPIAWRIRVREGHATFYIYTERLPFEPDADSQIVVLGEPEPLYAALRLSPVMEGMPSIEQLRVAIADGFNNGNQQYEDCDAFMRMRFDAAARAVAALSAPHPQARGEDESAPLVWGTTVEHLRKTICSEWGSILCYEDKEKLLKQCDPCGRCRCADIARAIISEHVIARPSEATAGREALSPHEGGKSFPPGVPGRYGTYTDEDSMSFPHGKDDKEGVGK